VQLISKINIIGTGGSILSKAKVIPNEVLIEFAEMIQSGKYDDIPNKWVTIARILSEKFSININSELLRGKFRRGYGVTKVSTMPVESVSIRDKKVSETPEGTEISYSVDTAYNKPLSLEETIEIFKIDTDMWEITDWITKYWDLTARDGKFYRNYQGNLKLKKRMDLSLSELTSIFKKQSLEFQRSIDYDIPRMVNDVTYEYRDTDTLLELVLFDVHLGKLCWAAETKEDYDLKIAENRFKKLILNLLSVADKYGYSRVLLPIGNDFLHMDNIEGTTTKGTRLDVDGRFKKVFQKGEEILVWAIDTLRAKAPVDVLIVPGNHDNTSMWQLGEFLKGWYRNCPNSVNIDNAPIEVKYYQYGKNLIMFNHGEIADKRLVQMMPQCNPKGWASSTTREIHLGHLHTDSKTELMPYRDYNGIVIQRFKSMTGTDYWHFSNGFVGSMKGADGLLFHKDEGRILSFQKLINL